MPCLHCRDARYLVDTKQPHRRALAGGAVDSLLAGADRTKYIAARPWRVKRKSAILTAYLAGRIDGDLARWHISLTGPFRPLSRGRL